MIIFSVIKHNYKICACIHSDMKGKLRIPEFSGSICIYIKTDRTEICKYSFLTYSLFFSASLYHQKIFNNIEPAQLYICLNIYDTALPNCLISTFAKFYIKVFNVYKFAI